MGKQRKRNIAIVIVLVVVIGASVYLGLAYPFPVQTTPLNLTGILTQTEIPVIVNWPNAQMRVSIQLTSVTAIWSYEIRDADNNFIDGTSGISTSTTTITTPWLDATGSYTIIITCVGDLEGTITVFARGWPFITL